MAHQLQLVALFAATAVSRRSIETKNHPDVAALVLASFNVHLLETQRAIKRDCRRQYCVGEELYFRCILLACSLNGGVCEKPPRAFPLRAGRYCHFRQFVASRSARNQRAHPDHFAAAFSDEDVAALVDNGPSRIAKELAIGFLDPKVLFYPFKIQISKRIAMTRLVIQDSDGIGRISVVVHDRY